MEQILTQVGLTLGYMRNNTGGAQILPPWPFAVPPKPAQQRPRPPPKGARVAPYPKRRVTGASDGPSGGGLPPQEGTAEGGDFLSL